MTGEIICVGTEILLGDIVNTNAAYIAKGLASLGISCFFQDVVGDNDERLRETFELARSRADLIILCGGLGPTRDDMTLETVSNELGIKLVENKEVKEHILDLVKDFNFSSKQKNITKNNLKMALVPEGAKIIQNSNGQAPGIIIEKSGKTVIFLPGPPGEMIPMFDEGMLPYLKEKQDVVLESVTVKVATLGESRVADMIDDLITRQTNPTVATYAKPGEVHVRVTAKAESTEEAFALIDPMVAELKQRFKDNVITTDVNETFAQAVVRLLKEHHLTLSTVESCTGGKLADRIVDVSGASEVYKAGLVTYSNEAKENLAGVDRDIIEKYTAVSSETAAAMAEGCRKKTGTDICVSTTGNAGPEPSEGKPVGLVFIGISTKESTKTLELHLDGNRQKIRERTTVKALTLIRETILKSTGKV